MIFQASHPIGEEIIRRFAATIGDWNPLYWDAGFAGKSPYGGITAPPTLLFELTYDLQTAIGEDGLYGGFRKWLGCDVNLQRAGNDYEMIQPVVPGDIISFRRRVVDVQEKKGKKGRFAFLLSEVRYTNQRGEVLGIDRETLALPLNED
jgi:acyl dehydratase